MWLLYANERDCEQRDSSYSPHTNPSLVILIETGNEAGNSRRFDVTYHQAIVIDVFAESNDLESPGR
jgi:hypothetical protein